MSTTDLAENSEGSLEGALDMIDSDGGDPAAQQAASLAIVTAAIYGSASGIVAGLDRLTAAVEENTKAVRSVSNGVHGRDVF